MSLYLNFALHSRIVWRIISLKAQKKNQPSEVWYLNVIKLVRNERFGLNQLIRLTENIPSDFIHCIVLISLILT